MKKKTFDMLDAELGQEVESWRNLTDEQRFKNYRLEFYIDPKNWDRNQPPDWAMQLEWKKFRYSSIRERSNLDELIDSDEPGIYIFYVRGCIESHLILLSMIAIMAM